MSAWGGGQLFFSSRRFFLCFVFKNDYSKTTGVIESSFIFPPLFCYVDGMEEGDFTDATQTGGPDWLAGWIPRKLYVYIAASLLVCPG